MGVECESRCVELKTWANEVEAGKDSHETKIDEQIEQERKSKKKWWSERRFLRGRKGPDAENGNRF